MASAACTADVPLGAADSKGTRLHCSARDDPLHALDPRISPRDAADKKGGRMKGSIQMGANQSNLLRQVMDPPAGMTYLHPPLKNFPLPVLVEVVNRRRGFVLQGS